MSDQYQNITASTRRQNAIPTNMISYKGRKIPARIDPEARIAYIVDIMSQSFNTREHHITLCLRDEMDNLVTQANLSSKVRDHETLKLVPSPTSEALAVVTSLQYAYHNHSPMNDSTVALPDQSVIPLKLALFNLTKFIKEEDFAVEFMLRGGIRTLIQLIERTANGLSGNSMAYALQGIRGILEFEAAWSEITDTFIDRCLTLLVTAPQTNVIRPATAVIRKLIVSSSSFDKKAKGKGKGKAKEGTEEKDVINPFGFIRIWPRMNAVQISAEGSNGASGVLKIVSKRLEGAGDLELVAQSLGLINACLKSAQKENSPYYQELINIIELLSVRRYVSRLIPISSNNIVEPQILAYQARHTAVLQHSRLRPVRPAQYPEHEKMLNDIWQAGRLGNQENANVEGSDAGSRERNCDGWKRMGLWVDEQEGAASGGGPFIEGDLFRDSGELGLDCLHWFVMHEESFHNLVIEIEARVPDRRCPIGKASAECLKILSDHYKVSQAGHHASSTFQLFLLNLPRLHSLVLKFFIRMWTDSESRLPDFDRLSLLVRSQIKLSLADEASKTWLHLEKDFLEADYRTIRDRQMELMEKEDGLFTRSSIKELRDKLGKEAYDVLAQQRVGCMLQGAWFNANLLLVPGIIPSHKASPSKPLRFVRLSPSKRTLAWGEFAKRETTPPTYESLRERVDLSNVTDVRLQTGCAVNSRSQNLISKLSFSLMSGSELSLLDLDAVHSAQLAEWVDGVRVLKDEGGMSMQETASYCHILTELALKVRLLDITGDGVELPEKVEYGPPPASVDFWFAK